MFYNRWGFALLSVLFLLCLPRLRGREGEWMDAAVAAAVLLLTFYLKISYFAVASAFMLPLLYLRRTRRMAVTACLLTATGIALVHLVWSGTGAYFQDIAIAAQASGAIRGSIPVLAQLTLDNAATLLPFLLILGLAAAAGISFGPLFLSASMAGAGLLLANQNHQGLGIVTLIPAAILVSASMEATSDQNPREKLRLAATLLLITIAIPPAFAAARSVLVHMAQPYAGSGAIFETVEIDGFQAQEIPSTPADAARPGTARALYRSDAADLETVQILRAPLSQPEYFSTVEDGLQMLRRDRLAGKLFVMDFSNPLNALSGRSAPRGVDSWYHRGRTFSEDMFRAANETFADVDVIMVPKAPADRNAHFLLIQIYGRHIQDHYRLAATSDYWRAYVRKIP